MNGDDRPDDGPTQDRDATPSSSPSGQTGSQGSVGDVTMILSAIESGDGHAAAQLLPLVYEELRKLAAAKMAQEKPGQTLQSTALVHEAYVRLVDVDKAQNWGSRGHFFAAAAEAMRRILVDRARDKGRMKRGGHLGRVDLDTLEVGTDAPGDDLLLLDEAIVRLGEENQEFADLVKLRFFAGLSVEEAGAAMGISARTARRHWAYSRAWLFRAIRQDDTPTPA